MTETPPPSIATPGPAGSSPSSLIRRLLGHLVAEDLPAGAHLAEQTLAQALNVSRTPVRRALMELAAEGLVEKQTNRGYFLTRPARALFVASLEFPVLDEDSLFERVAMDHSSGALPPVLDEANVASCYGVSARLARRVLEALEEHTIIVAHKSGGWVFNSFFRTSDANQASYAYRLVTEPQIPLLPSFAVQRELLRNCRDEHIRLLSLPPSERSSALAFKVDAAFHEAIAVCGNNPFFRSGVTQHNRLRQVLQYRGTPDDGRIMVWLIEHLDIMEALIANDREEASTLIRVHLENARQHWQRRSMLLNQIERQSQP